MKKITLFLISTLLIYVYYLKGQVKENMLMERFNMNAFNPAYVGSDGREVSFTTRSTWSKGVKDALPKTNYFYYGGNPKKNLSLGLSVLSNKVYIDRRNQYTADASKYRLEMGGGTKLFYLGGDIKAGAGSNNTDIDGLKRITNEPNASIAATSNSIFPIFGFGALLKSEKFYISASIPNFLNPGKFVKDDSFVGSEKPNTYLLAGTSFNTGIFNSKLNPFVSAKLIPDGENQTHIGATLGFGDIIEIGTGYKSTGYTNALLMIKTKFGIIIAFAYDYGIPSGSSAVTKSGNEIF